MWKIGNNQMSETFRLGAVLALAGGFTGPFEAERLVNAFLTTEFEGGRHERRVNLVMETETL